MKKLFLMIWTISVLFGFASAHAVVVDFTPFNIRNNNSTTTAPWDGDLSIVENAAGDGFAAETPQSGQKVGYGTNAFNGWALNTLSTVNWDKVSGKDNVVSYLNMWVTDNAGNYAIISSENDYRGADFATRNEWKVFEFGPDAATPPASEAVSPNLDWLLDSGAAGRTSQYLTKNGSNVNLLDFAANIVFFEGPVGPSVGVGSGAPRGGFGFNLIFGDTQANFVGDYELENLQVEFGNEVFDAGVSPVPLPAAAWLFGSMIMGFIGVKKRRKIFS